MTGRRRRATSLTASTCIGYRSGAGGHFVRLNGLVYEAVTAFRERRPRFDLYHSALVVRVPEASFVIETAWPIPDDEPALRGVVLEGPVFQPSDRAIPHAAVTRCVDGGTA